MSADNTIFNDPIIDEYGDSDLREFIKTQQVIYGRKGTSLNFWNPLGILKLISYAVWIFHI